MKKLFLFILVTLLAFPNLLLAGENNFRETKWGMSVEEVKNAEKSTFKSEGNDSLAYTSNLLDNDCHIFYYFESGKLIQACYFFDNLQPIQSLSIFTELDSLYIKKYQTSMNISDILREYKNKDTSIKMIRNKSQVVIFYSDLEYENNENKKRNQQRKNDLSKF